MSKGNACRKKINGSKIAIVVLAALLVIAIVVTCLATCFFNYVQGERSDELWKTDMEYSRDYSKTLYKDHNKDFVILNFTDIQITFPFSLAKSGLIYSTMKKAIDEAQPDLITFTGDQAWGLMTRQCYQRLAKVMDSFGIPWAFTYGNHDREGNGDLAALADVVKSSKYCLFAQGPRNVTGVGNYSINIVDKDTNEIVHTVIMMDSGDSSYNYRAYYEDEVRMVEAKENWGIYYEQRDALGLVQVGSNSYAAIANDQIGWYEWLLTGIQTQNNGKMPTSTCMFHIPLVEYFDAYAYWAENNFDSSIGIGHINEAMGCAAISTGFFAKMQEMGSTKNVVVGHDHVNDMVVSYQGINLAYGVKTGDQCYWVEDGSMNGGTTITIGQDGSSKIAQLYVNPYGVFAKSIK